jgi:diphthamide biosynthesis methyltransferase
MATYTIILTEAEDIALKHVAASAQDWIENAVKERCRTAIEEIVKNHVDTQLKAGLPLAGTTHEEIVLNAGIESAAQRNERFEAQQNIIPSNQ